MADRYVDIANVKLEAESLGVVELLEVMELKVTNTKERNRVNTMNRRRLARGYRSGTKEVNGTLTIARAVEPEVDYHTLFESDELFQLYVEWADSGKRRHIVDCIVSEIEAGADEGGEPTWEISFEAIDDRPLR